MGRAGREERRELEVVLVVVGFLRWHGQGLQQVGKLVLLLLLLLLFGTFYVRLMLLLLLLMLLLLLHGLSRGPPVCFHADLHHVLVPLLELLVLRVHGHCLLVLGRGKGRRHKFPERAGR